MNEPAPDKPASYPEYGASEVFFQYDVSSVEEGDLVPEWGTNAMALGADRFIGSQKPGLHKIARQIPFPRDWSMELTIINHANDGARGDDWLLPISLMDVNGDAMVIPFKLYDYMWDYKWVVELPGVAPADVPSAKQTNLVLRVAFKAGQLKVFANDAFLTSVVHGDKYGPFTTLGLTIRGGDLAEEAIGYRAISVTNLTE